MGGNQLTEVPITLGQLKNLTALVLSDNQLSSLPTGIAKLNNLKSLLLHKNKLKTLPTEIVALKCLTEVGKRSCLVDDCDLTQAIDFIFSFLSCFQLSLRDNPLVVRFVSDMTHTVPSLLELAARTVKLHSVEYGDEDLPRSLLDYLSSAHHCINPRCKG